MIGKDAKTEKVAKKSTYSNLSSMAHAFELAEAVATAERPILSSNGMTLATTQIGSAKTAFHSVTQVPIASGHNLMFGVGSAGQGFYQVPVIQLNSGIDAVLSGQIDDKGEATKYQAPKTLSGHISEKYALDMNRAQRVFGIALIPVADGLDDQLLVAGVNTKSTKGIYSLGTNGFLLNRGIIGGYGQIAPIMFPDAEGRERYLKATEVLSKGEVAALEQENVFPGLMVVAGSFQETPRYDFLINSPVYRGGSESFSRGMSLGFDSPSMSKSAGRVGVETGDASSVKYGTTTGRVTSIDGLLALHLLAVGPRTTPEEVKDALKAYQR